jgi:hypothetical protein
MRMAALRRGEAHHGGQRRPADGAPFLFHPLEREADGPLLRLSNYTGQLAA